MSDIACCEKKTNFIYCWDNPYPDEGDAYAFNVYACDHCGALYKEHVWNNKGVTKVAAGESLWPKEPLEAGQFRLVEDEDEGTRHWEGGGPSCKGTRFDAGEPLILSTDAWPVGTVVQALEPELGG